MRLPRRRRRAAVVLLLLLFAAVIFLTSWVPVLQSGRNGRTRVASATIRRHGQHVFRDLFFKEKSPTQKSTELHVHSGNNEEAENDEESEDMDVQLPPDNSTASPEEVNVTQIFYDTHWMTIHGGGRLGNAMFQYASLVGISSYHGYKSTLQGSHSLRRIFKLKSPPSASMRIKVNTKREKYPGTFDPKFLELKHDWNWTLIGYFQSWKYFGNISERIREEFTFRDTIIKEMLKEAPVLANWTRVTVGVHVRRGDMTSRYERERGYNVADLGFLNRSMNYFRKKYENPIFLICSDNITWCRENLRADDTMVMTGSREVDLATLAHCDHNIVTSGSFGWWGAWLAGGDVVYFKHFPRENTWLDRQYKRADYYPSPWVGME